MKEDRNPRMFADLYDHRRAGTVCMLVTAATTAVCLGFSASIPTAPSAPKNCPLPIEGGSALLARPTVSTYRR